MRNRAENMRRYHDIVQQMGSGPVIAMEIRQENAVDTFRKLVRRNS